MARSTLRRTQRRTNRRRLQRGGEGQRQVEEELMRCKKRIKNLEKLLSLFTDGTLTDEQFFNSVRRILQSSEPVPVYESMGPNSSDERFFDNLRNTPFLGSRSGEAVVPRPEGDIEREQREIREAQERRRLEREAALARISDYQQGDSRSGRSRSREVSSSERRSMENDMRAQQRVLGSAVPKDKKMSRSAPEEMTMFNGRMVPKYAVDRLKYYQDKAANSTPAELKEFKKGQRKEKRWRSAQEFSGRSKSRYRARP